MSKQLANLVKTSRRPTTGLRRVIGVMDVVMIAVVVIVIAVVVAAEAVAMTVETIEVRETTAAKHR